MKTRLTAVFLTVALFLSACGGAKPAANRVSAAELTERERAILSISTDKFVGADYQVGPEYTQIKVWVEKYVFGERQEDTIGSLQCMISGSGTILYAQGKPGEGPLGLREAHLSVIDANGGSAVSVPPTAIGGGGVACVWGELSDRTPFAQEMVLGDIGYNGKDTVRTLTDDFYRDPAAHMDELKPYDEIYLLRCQFIK